MSDGGQQEQLQFIESPRITAGKKRRLGVD